MVSPDDPAQETAPERKPDAASAEPPKAAARPPLDSNGMERPRFLLDFPEDPELERLISAFERGNFALIRTEAEKLARTTENAAVRDAALELRRRIDPDPLAKYLLAISALLLVILTVWAYSAASH